MSKENKKKIKTTKLDELEQADGRLIEKDVTSTRLDVLLGATGLGKYGTLDKEEYKKKIDNFNTADLRNHAIHAGLIPIPDITRLKKQLLVEFDKYTIAFTSPTKFKIQQMSKDKQKMALDIMAGAK
jgi:hypothetical protein